MVRAGADAVMGCPARRAALWHRDDAFLYEFARDPAGVNGQAGWAHHASDIPFTFHILNVTGPNADEFLLASPSDIKLSADILSFWSSFAANGAPDEWPVITGHAAMLFPDSPRRPYVVSGFKELACNAWDQAQQSGVVLRGI